MNEKQLKLLKELVAIFPLRDECVKVSLTTTVETIDKRLLELCHSVYAESFAQPNAEKEYIRTL